MACQCGHSIEEHGNNPDFRGSTECDEKDADVDGCDCVAYEEADEDEA